MSGSVGIVFTFFPKCHTRESIQLYSTGTTWEFNHRKLYHTYQNEGTVATKLISNSAQSESTGNICGPFQILATGIHKDAAGICHFLTSILFGRVMNNGTIPAISYNAA